MQVIRKFISLNKGQLLVELMVAISVMVIGMLGIFTVLSQSLGLSKVATNQYVAANLAAEGIEVVKNIIDANTINSVAWNEGVSVSGTYRVQYNSTSLNGAGVNNFLNYDQSTGLYSYDSGNPTNFRRIITINNVSPDEIRVSSRVEWKDRGGASFDIEVEDHFLNWRQDIL